jgi:hypothetical protein
MKTIGTLILFFTSFSLFAQSLPTPVTGYFTDYRNGRTYKWVLIGNQTWMTENLAYLPSVSPPSVKSTTSPVYYV